MSSSKNILSGPKEWQQVPNISLGTYMLRTISNHGNKIAQVHSVTGETATYAEILTRSLSLAESLRARGVKNGDVVGICSENNLEFCLPMLAALFVGATCATFSPVYTKRELLHSLGISRPTVVFCSPLTAARMGQAAGEVGFVRTLVVFGADAVPPQIAMATMLRREPARESYDDGADHVAVLLCSSGTTGLPKGVMLTDRNILTSLAHLGDSRFGDLSPNDVYMAILPFFHAYGYIIQLSSLSLGMTTVVIPRFEEELFLRTIQNHKVSLLFLVPPLLVFLGKHPLVDRYNLSSVKSIWCGAAPLREEVQSQVTKRLGIKQIRQGYGMTETTLAVLLTPPKWNKHGSSGQLAPGTQCKVVDLESGRPVGPYVSGELCFKGPLVMKGYCGDLQATSACTDQDGFLHTGDVGYYDRDGFFFIVDRLKELIKYKGFQVPPAELEAILLTHPGIKDAAVIGIADEEAGELPLAFVVRQPGVAITEEAVIKHVEGQVSSHKRLHGGVRFVESIPKTVSGKILRRELRDSVLKSKL